MALKFKTPWIVMSLILCCNMVIKGQNDPNISKNEIINLYNQSQDLLSKGNFDEALKLKSEAYYKSKELPELNIIGGLCAFDIAQMESDIYKDLKSYINWLERADECEFPGAAGLLGDAYLTGQDGVPQDFQKAKFYYEKSDEGRCLWILATMYGPNGELGRNDSEWLKYTSKAVEKGDADAQFMLGLCYLDGKFVSKNNNKGVELIKMAAQQNHIKAIRFLESENIK